LVIIIRSEIYQLKLLAIFKQRVSSSLFKHQTIKKDHYYQAFLNSCITTENSAFKKRCLELKL